MPFPVAYSDERESIEETFLTAWNALDPPSGPAPIEVDNVRFDAKQIEDAEWGRFTIIGGEGEQVSLGTKPCMRIQGQMVLQLFAPEKTGTEAIRTLADQFLDIWKDANGVPLELSKNDSGRIRTQLGWLVRDGVLDGWYQMRAIVPFTRDIRAT